MLEVNIGTLTKLCKFFTKDMKAAESGKILNVASTAGFQPGPTAAVYYATKAYVVSFSQALSHELKPFGVTVSVLCPGPTKTNFAKIAHMEKSGVFNSSNVMSAAKVAEVGYKGLMDGKILIVPGFLNKFGVFTTRLIPRSLAAKFAQRFQANI